jgi:hypothetical protein
MDAIRRIAQDARRGHLGLFWLATSMIGLSVLLVGFALLDTRVLLGAPIWTKPLKFALSFVLYGTALAWMLSRLRPGSFRVTGWVITAGAFIEMIVIAGQAARGVRSHFNDDSALDAALYSQVMALTVAVMWLATLAIAVRFLRADLGDPPTTTAVRAGLLVAVAGMAVGIVMSANQGHAVGVVDGGPGLPFVGWSTTGGDLRVGHFVGMHALQVLPLLAALLATTGLPGAVRQRLVVIGSAGFAGLVALVVWQALRGQPLLAPDGLTLAALAALVLAATAAVIGALRSGTGAPDERARVGAGSAS